MKNALIITVSLISILSVSSCKRSYSCVCVDSQGKKTETVVTGTSLTQARDNCDQYGNKGNCTVSK